MSHPLGFAACGTVANQVVLATHSDHALALLEDASPVEHSVLSAIPYQVNEAVLHTDVRMLPRRRRAWASWNYHLLPEPSGLATVTYHMNRLQALRADRQFCVTLNRSEAIDPRRTPPPTLLTANLPCALLRTGALRNSNLVCESSRRG